ncbi:MAG TPA: DMT family transporter [Rhizomicrobium sp.]|nr:DMT family transporter [Rhizomicrobium sp.]
MGQTSRIAWAALIAVNITAVLFGSTGLFGKLDVSPAWIVVGRALFAAAALLVILLLRRSSLVPEPRERRALAASGAALAVHWLTFFWSVQQAGIAVATLTFATFPAGIVAIEAVRRRRWPLGVELGAALTIVFSVMLLVQGGLPPLAHAAMGALLGLVSAATFALFSIISQALGSQANLARLSFCQNAVVVLVTAPMLVFAARMPHGPDWFWLALLGVAATALAHQLYFYGLKKLPASVCGGFASLEPVYAIFFANLLFHEQIRPAVFISGVMIIAASLVLLFWTKNPVAAI